MSPVDSDASFEDRSGSIAIWNPNAAANWSFLFSPMFGAWLHSKNWSALGDTAKAKQSMMWVYFGPVVILISMFLPAGITRLIGIAYLLSWYISSAKAQVKYVKENLNDQYAERGWVKPIAITIGCFIAFVVLVTAIDLATH